MIKKKEHRYAGDLCIVKQTERINYNQNCIGHIELSFNHFPSDYEFLKKGITNGMIVPEKTKYEFIFSTVTRDYSFVEIVTTTGLYKVVTVSNIRRIQ